MQGIVYMPEDFQAASSAADSTHIMDISLHPNLLNKDLLLNKINQSDSGIHSATGNFSLSDENMDQSQNSDVENRSESSSPERKYFCPICETVFTSQHEFTLHIRSHNNESEPQDCENKNYTCRICFKVLSSSSSLDRHSLIHSGERPFTCKYCGDTFTTNGNMHRHMRTHSQRNDSYESDASISSNDSKGIEYNNNNNKINNNKSDNSKDSNSNEDNNNENKRIYSEDKYSNPKRMAMAKEEPQDLSNRNQLQNYQCSVCERNDFTSINALEMHLEDNHKNCLTMCKLCNQNFKNNKLLNFHYKIAHQLEETEKVPSVVGFKDLTFVDFSSEKFPYIAKYECEKNLHKASSGPKFICKNCGRAFPCSNSLEIHKNDCFAGLDLSTNGNKPSSQIPEEKDVKRAEFFARLDLHSNSPKNKIKSEIPSETIDVKEKLQKHLLQSIEGTKDLADIQSIISMTTCGSLLQHLQTKTNEIPLLPLPSNPLERRNHEIQKQENEEESQDAFAAEFRKMKLRGEFPCRLCTAVFPNLRALKGHNRAHLNSNNNGTYRCNMCPHSSIDKAALIRHMRTHNGDRPYECSLCNYAFTTKANCERHLRNRHAKSTREEVKKSIIYHPSEDPSNDEITKMLSREEAKKGSSNNEVGIAVNDTKSPNTNKSSFNVRDRHNFISENFSFNSRIPSSHNLPITANFLSLKNSLQLKQLNDEGAVIAANDEVVPSCADIKNKKDFLSPYLTHSLKFSPKVENISTPQSTPKLQVKKIDTLKETTASEESNYNLEEDESMNYVLDLSKKKNLKEEENLNSSNDLPQDLTKKSETDHKHNVGDILTQQLLKNTPKIDPLYASQLAFYRNSFHGLSGFPYWPLTCNPLLFSSVQPPIFPQNPQDIKDRLQRLQFCSGGMIMDNFKERLKHLQHVPIPNLNSPNPNKNEQIPDMSKSSESSSILNSNSSENMDKSSSLNITLEPNYPESISNVQSPVSSHSKSEIVHSSNSVKMVIKNGILMPKQKQRRYRTERPFSCEHCSARFTLRSNMERHIKQQHPQFWSQRQRSNLNTLGRKGQTPNPKDTLCNINIPTYHLPKSSELPESKGHKISDKIKYAILAQHLKSTQEANPYSLETQIKEDDDDCELIIDENDDSGFKNSNNNEQSNKRSGKENVLDERSSLQDDEKSGVFQDNSKPTFKNEDIHGDLVPVSRLLDNASQQPFKDYFNRENEEHDDGNSEEEEEGLVASSSTSEENNSGTDENRSESENNVNSRQPPKKKSAYSLAPNRVSCPYCQRKFPWTSSLRRHILTHTGQKPFKCSHCPLLFTTKSNCDRHLLRKHGNSATTITNAADNSQTPNYLMRNVPERPFKCSNCPSSTFSTYSNLKKHINCKHSTPSSQSDDAHSQVSTGYEAGSSEDEKQLSNGNQTDWDKQVSQNRINVSNGTVEIQNSHVQNSELPFKCHLCDNSFAERQDTLDHIKDKHISEYELLMSKNALESHLTVEDSGHQYEDDNEVRGKFPDYTNRKVICAFCMRRFWSAEDLRRHMRTHTGERPFSCDICQRRFTLKHSMLRHRKKHNVAFENDTLNSDEDININNNPTCTNLILHDKLTKLNRLKSTEKTDDSDGAEGSDLISNLLGIRDRSIIDQVLTASADDAAKLLGVKSGAPE